jgi:hypothetical protein
VALQCSAGLGLLGDGALGGCDEFVAPAQLLEQALRSARGRLRQLAGAGVEEAPRPRNGHAGEGLGKGGQRFHHPDAAQKPVRKRRDVPLGTHQLRKLLPARH